MGTKYSDLGDPCETALVIIVNEAAKRILSQPVFEKEPIKPCQLRLLAEKFGGDVNFMNLRLLALCAVGFAGFLKFDNLSSINPVGHQRRHDGPPPMTDGLRKACVK